MLKEQIDHKINFIQQELQTLEVPLIVVGHSIGSFMSLEVYKKIPEKVAYIIALYPFSVDTESQQQSVIKKISSLGINLLQKSHWGNRGLLLLLMLFVQVFLRIITNIN